MNLFRKRSPGPAIGQENGPPPAQVAAPRGLAALRRKMRRAQRLTQRGKHTEAVALLKELTAAHPQDLALALHLGALYYGLGQHTPAIEQFTRATRIEPGNPRAWLNIAAAENALGHIERAETALARVSEISPDYPDLHYNRAVLCLKRRGTLEAMAELELELSVAPDNLLASKLLSQLRQKLM